MMLSRRWHVMDGEQETNQYMCACPWMTSNPGLNVVYEINYKRGRATHAGDSAQ